jgi:hypothetical protein
VATTAGERVEPNPDEQAAMYSGDLGRLGPFTDEEWQPIDDWLPKVRLEFRYDRMLANYFGGLIWPVEKVVPFRLPAVMAARDAGILSIDEVAALRHADFVVAGKRTDDADHDTYVLAQVCATIRIDDVRRAVQRADILRRAGLDTIPFVGGNAIDIDAADEAWAAGVHVDIHSP